MLEFLTHLFDTAGFPPRWRCGTGWTDAHGWLHIASDLAIFGAYAAIPCVLAWFVRKRTDVPFSGVFWMFAGFIMFCGLSHLAEAVIFWYPWYRFSGMLKLCTAIASWGTVFALIPILPRALALPGLGTMNERLQREIAERAQVEERLRETLQQLREEEHRYRSLANAVPTAVWTCNDDGRYTYLNDHWERFTGLTSQESLGDAWQRAVHPDDLPACRRSWQNALAAGQSWEHRFRLRQRNGGYRWYLGRAVAMESVDGRAGTWFGTTTDIEKEISTTEQLRISREQLSEQARELKRSNTELEHFAYVASHDLQEPLRKITSFCQILQHEYQGRFDPDADMYIGYTVDAARRMRKLISDLLAYSRVSRSELLLRRVDAAAACSEALANLETAIAESGAEIRCDELPTVMADHTQMVSVFQNLIGNAIKYRADEAPRIHISSDRSGNEWTFCVRDNGIGIEQQYHTRIFGVFQRLHNAEDFPGTGIGLALCKRIVERWNGTIWVESTPGSGSRFCFTAPAV